MLEILDEHHGTLSGCIVLLDADVGRPRRSKPRPAMTLADGAHAPAIASVKGITGRVVQSGKPVVVPRVSHEPLFLNRTGVLKESGKDEVSLRLRADHGATRAPSAPSA